MIEKSYQTALTCVKNQTKPNQTNKQTRNLAGTNWGASISILRQVYTGNVRPVIEYGAAAWATTAKTNTSSLAEVQIKGMDIITGGLKTTSTLALETATRFLSLDQGREQKILIHSEKIKRFNAHPVSSHLQKPTKNRLKRTTFNHLVKHLAMSPLKRESHLLMLMTGGARRKTCSSLPKCQESTKNGQRGTAHKASTLEMLDQEYNT